MLAVGNELKTFRKVKKNPDSGIYKLITRCVYTLCTVDDPEEPDAWIVIYNLLKSTNQ